LEGLSSAQERLAAIAASSKPRAYILDPLWQSVDHDLCTPSFLIARDQADAEAIQRRAPASYSLRKANAQVVAEREEEVRRRYQAAASFRDSTIPADLFASATHQDWLLDYEPVYGWEKRPLIAMDRQILVGCGIDPATVTCAGHAAAIKKEIYKRRAAGLAEIGSLALLAARQGLATIPADMWQRKHQQTRGSAS
jgi:hypothetical protein